MITAFNNMICLGFRNRIQLKRFVAVRSNYNPERVFFSFCCKRARWLRLLEGYTWKVGRQILNVFTSLCPSGQNCTYLFKLNYISSPYFWHQSLCAKVPSPLPLNRHVFNWAWTKTPESRNPPTRERIPSPKTKFLCNRIFWTESSGRRKQTKKKSVQANRAVQTSLQTKLRSVRHLRSHFKRDFDDASMTSQ